MTGRTSLPRFLALYAALFAAFGVASPFMPGLLQQDGLDPGALGAVLAAGTAIRLLSGPFGGRLADRTGHAPAVLAGFAAIAAMVALGYVPARGFGPLLLVSVAHAAVLAPLTPISDALALGSSREAPGFDYGWVRAAGSGAFILGALLSGQLVGDTGLGIIVWLNAGLLAVAACLARVVPERVAGTASTPVPSTAQPPSMVGVTPRAASMRSLLALPAYVRLMAAAALIGGSHALHDSFEVIRWRVAGMSAAQASLLWALSVASELVVFLFLGRWLLERLGPAWAVALSGVAGVVRWGTAAQTALFPVMVLVEPLHGLTFALLHLACMETIGRVVPARLAATAQACYATIAMGGTAALVTLAAGPLYGRFGAGAFWAMAAMCALALPIVPSLRTDAAREHSRAKSAV